MDEESCGVFTGATSFMNGYRVLSFPVEWKYSTKFKKYFWMLLTFVEFCHLLHTTRPDVAP